MPHIEFVCPSCQRRFEREVTAQQLASAMQAFNRGDKPTCRACERGYQRGVEAEGFKRTRVRKVE